MRITVSIDESDIREVQKFTGEKTKSQAVSKAVEGFLKQVKAMDFANRAAAGEYDHWFSDTDWKEIERVELADADATYNALKNLGDR